jgi:hypothetical protein
MGEMRNADKNSDMKILRDVTSYEKYETFVEYFLEHMHKTKAWRPNEIHCVILRLTVISNEPLDLIPF